MAEVLASPARGATFVDARGCGRALRVTWHHEAGLVVLSLWRDDVCTGTFRLPAAEVPTLLAGLTEGLAAGYSSNAAGSGTSSSPGSIAR